MQRLVSLKVAVALALAVGLVAYFVGAHSGSTAIAQAPIRWKVQSAWPPTSIVQDAAKLLVETIEKNSGGRLKLDLSPAGAVVPPFEIQDAVNRGVLDAGQGAGPGALQHQVGRGSPAAMERVPRVVLGVEARSVAEAHVKARLQSDDLEVPV